MKALLVTLFTLLMATSLMASRKYSKADGAWETSSTWNAGAKPVSNDTIIISAGDTVSVSTNINDLTHVVIMVYGLLDLTDNGKLDLDNTSKIFVATGGKIIGDGNSDKIKIGSEIWNGNNPPVVGPKYADGGSGGFQPWSVLAANFQSFYVTRQGTNIQLSWSTVAELNNAYYAIERSIDSRTWKQIATLSGAGTTNVLTQYGYTDNNMTDAVAYYRIRQVDKTGGVSYSLIRSVRNNENSEVANIYASLNKTIIIDFNSDVKDNVSIQLINMGGQVIVRKEFKQASYRLIVDAMSAGSGVYAVRVSDSKGWSEVKKIAL